MNTSNQDEIVEHNILLERVNSTIVLDSLYLFIITIIELIGALLNAVSFITLFKIKKSNKVIYKYLRVYTLNTSICCVISMLAFYSYSPRYFEFALEYGARIYRCIILNFVGTTLYFFSNMLDVVISLERLSLFITPLKNFKHIQPYLLSAGILVVCTVLNLPTFFLMEPVTDRDFFNASSTSNTSNSTQLVGCYCSQTVFFTTTLGQAFAIFTFICRDFLTTGIELIFCILSITKLQRFRTTELGSQYLDAKLYDSEMKLFLMTLYLSSLSIVSHIFVFLSYVSFMMSLNGVVFRDWLPFLAIFSVSIKHSTNFFLIYNYSTLFREKLKKTFLHT